MDSISGWRGRHVLPTDVAAVTLLRRKDFSSRVRGERVSAAKACVRLAPCADAKIEYEILEYEIAMKQLALSLAMSRIVRILLVLLRVRSTHAASATVVVLLLLFSQAGQGADPLDSWTWRNPLPTANNLYGIAYGNGLFVAVGASGTIITSNDGLNWTLRHLGPSPVSLSGVAYGNGQFVAVGNSVTDGTGAVLTSTDGINWVQHAQGTNNLALKGIAFGDGQFVAVGYSSLQTSTDGVNWVQHYLDTFGRENGYWLFGVTFGDGQFVAVGEGAGNAGRVVSSPDGVNWTVHGSVLPSASAGSALYGAAYGGGQFVAVGDVDPGISSAAILTSTDAVNWLKRDPGTQVTGYLFGVAYGNGLFAAVGGSTILTSQDGVSWKDSGLLDQGPLFAIAYGDNRFVAVGSGGAILTSTDGLTWVRGQRGTTDRLSAITYGNGQFVAVGSPDGNSTILTSSDGINWAQRPSGISPGTNPLNGVAYGNGQFVAVGDGIVVTSVDGMTWLRQPATNAANEWPAAVTYGNGQFVALGVHGGISTSTNGVNWVRRDSGLSSELQYAFSGATYGGGQFVAVGHVATYTNGYETLTPIILSSTDGLSWGQLDPGISATNAALLGVAYGNGQFVAVAGTYLSYYRDCCYNRGGVIVTSTDGVHWTERFDGDAESNSVGPLVSVAYGSGQFVVLGRPGLILTSRDGVNWVQRQSGAQFGLLNAVAYGNGHFVAAGWQGAILQSGSIITLTVAPKPNSNLLTLSLEGPIGQAYTIQNSTDLVAWRNLTNITTTQPTSVILDALPASSERKFYRAYSQ